jgi:hypothetical protein
MFGEWRAVNTVQQNIAGPSVEYADRISVTAGQPINRDIHQNQFLR